MTALVGFVTAASSTWATGAFGFVGVLVGAGIAGGISLRVAERNRRAAEEAWVREARRAIYDRFLGAGQRLLIECERDHRRRATQEDSGRDYRAVMHRRRRVSREGESGEVNPAVHEAFSSLFEAYAAVQTVAGLPVVEAARAYSYRLWELKEELESRGVLDPQNFPKVSTAIREARHRIVNKMREDLALGIVALQDPYNPFKESTLADDYQARIDAGDDSPLVRPGSSAVSRTFGDGANASAPTDPHRGAARPPPAR